MTESRPLSQTSFLTSDTLIKLPSHKFWRQTFLLDELLSILLWSVTRISYDVKCLIDGAKGRAIQPSGGWAYGTLRLLPILGFKVRAEDIHLQIDCLTWQAPTLVLPDSAVIQSDINLICREPRQVGALLRELKEELQSACTETTDLIQPSRLGFPQIEFLEPGKEWKHAEMRLDLEMSFMPHKIVSENGQIHASMSRPLNNQEIVFDDFQD